MPDPDVDYVGDCQDLSQFADEVVDEFLPRTSLSDWVT